MQEKEFLIIIKELIKLAYREHYHCEDSWYNCPKHPEGAPIDRGEKNCNCGADKHNERVKKIEDLFNL